MSKSPEGVMIELLREILVELKKLNTPPKTPTLTTKKKTTKGSTRGKASTTNPD